MRLKQSEKYTLDDVINMSIKAALFDVHTVIPAEVLSYDPIKQQAQVKISINRVVNETEVEYPILDGIQVIFPRSGAHGITFPLEKGDGVLLLFSERSLERWRTTGPGNPPYDARRFDLNDAVAIPGMFPTAGIMVPPPVKATEVRGKKVFVGDPKQFITPFLTVPATPVPGTLTCTEPTEVTVAQLDLVGVLSVFMELMLKASYGGAPTTGGGGIDTITKPVLTQLISDLNNLKV